MFDNLQTMSQVAQKKLDGTVQFSDRVSDLGARVNLGQNILGGGVGLLLGAIITAPIRGIVSAVTDVVSVTAEIAEAQKGVADARAMMASAASANADDDEDVGVGA